MTLQDTIFALSSGGLPAGVAIVRISGPGVSGVLAALCGAIPAARYAHYTSIRDRNNQQIDTGLILYFPAPKSFTGEDVAEMHVHGGRAVVNVLMSTLSRLDGLRHAEAGEFSRRAFLNGKMDLVEVEGLADLISAETDTQRRLALEQQQGGLSALYNGWARRLTHARAMIEAELDFPDEDDVPGSVATTIWDDMHRLVSELETHLNGNSLSTVIRDGFHVVIVGPPNAGKSSLMNMLAKRDIAIVTDIAGTTRDILSVDLNLAGFVVKLSDTAGLRETSDRVEQEGIRRAHLALQDADLVLSLADCPADFLDLTSVAASKIVLQVLTKIDTAANVEVADGTLAISVVSGAGIEPLVATIGAHLPSLPAEANLLLPGRQRHVACVEQTLKALRPALAQRDIALELAAEHFRLAGDALGRLTGRVDVEKLLDVIFSEFCIGK